MIISTLLWNNLNFSLSNTAWLFCLWIFLDNWGAARGGWQNLHYVGAWRWRRLRRICGARRLRRCGVGRGDGSDLHTVLFKNYISREMNLYICDNYLSQWWFEFGLTWLFTIKIGGYLIRRNQTNPFQNLFYSRSLNFHVLVAHDFE